MPLNTLVNSGYLGQNYLSEFLNATFWIAKKNSCKNGVVGLVETLAEIRLLRNGPACNPEYLVFKPGFKDQGICTNLSTYCFSYLQKSEDFCDLLHFNFSTFFSQIMAFESELIDSAIDSELNSARILLQATALCGAVVATIYLIDRHFTTRRPHISLTSAN